LLISLLPPPPPTLTSLFYPPFCHHLPRRRIRCITDPQRRPKFHKPALRHRGRGGSYVQIDQTKTPPTTLFQIGNSALGLGCRVPVLSSVVPGRFLVTY
jgi:hypothetical protein